MVTHLPVTQFLKDALRVAEDGRDPILYLRCLVKYWEQEYQCAPSGWARRYSTRMLKGALAALRQLQRDHEQGVKPPCATQPILETNHERIF